VESRLPDDRLAGGASIRVAGVELPPSVVADLALRLHRAGELALSIHIGRAVDQSRDEVPLHARDYGTLLATLREGLSADLARLRAALEEHEQERLPAA
jgi:hypothetical protein